MADDPSKKSIGDRNYGLFILGQSLIAISLGALYSRWLVKSGVSFISYVAATLLAVYFIAKTIMALRREFTLSPIVVFTGQATAFLLLLSFGAQTPQLPLKEYILLGGALLMLPGLKELLWKVRRP